jgi:hypothetical protein
MESFLNDGVRKRVHVLRESLEELGNVQQPKFFFNSSFGRWEEGFYSCGGSTNMGNAFRQLRSLGHTNILVLTDGEPDSEADALDSAKGMTINVIYCGDGEPPRFLRELTNATGGKFGVVSFELNTPREIADVIKGYLSGR